ncbi:MAG: hypothetical protein ACK481_10630 [Candidatus Melainabacteria bacterium]|jgi:hypothetical protein
MSHEFPEKQLTFMKDVISLDTVREQKEGQQKLIGKKKVLAPELVEALNNINAQLAHKVRVEQEHNEILESQNNLLKSNNENLTSKVDRLVNTSERIIDSIGSFIVDGIQPDIKVCPSDKEESHDLAIAKFGCPSEAYYTKYSSQVVEIIGNGKLTPSMFGLFMRKFKVFGDRRFHFEETNGRKTKHQKYHPSVIKEIYTRLDNPARYGIAQSDANKFAQLIKPSQSLLVL